MSDEKALLAAIWGHPHDDNVRLVYADWLQENGDAVKAARAEFIRTQCELNRLESGDARLAELTNRAEALRKKYSGKWKGKVSSFVRQAKYHRGFPYPERQVRVCRFAAIPAAEWNQVPLWRIHLVQHSHKAFAPIPDSPHLLRIGRLAIRTGDWSGRVIQTDDAIRLLRSPNLRNLAALDFGYMRVGPGPFVALAEAPILPNLTSLTVLCCMTGGDAIAAFVASRYPEQLELLNWQYNAVPVSQLGALFGAANRFARLHSLTIHAALEEKVKLAEVLAAGGVFPALRVLTLSWGGATDELATVLATWPGLSRVPRLAIAGYHGLTLDGARALVNSPHAPPAFESLDCHYHYGAKPAVVKLLRDRFGPSVRD